MSCSYTGPNYDRRAFPKLTLIVFSILFYFYSTPYIYIYSSILFYFILVYPIVFYSIWWFQNLPKLFDTWNESRSPAKGTIFLVSGKSLTKLALTVQTQQKTHQKKQRFSCNCSWSFSTHRSQHQAAPLTRHGFHQSFGTLGTETTLKEKHLNGYNNTILYNITIWMLYYRHTICHKRGDPSNKEFLYVLLVHFVNETCSRPRVHQKHTQIEKSQPRWSCIKTKQGQKTSEDLGGFLRSLRQSCTQFTGFRILCWFSEVQTNQWNYRMIRKCLSRFFHQWMSLFLVEVFSTSITSFWFA